MGADSATAPATDLAAEPTAAAALDMATGAPATAATPAACAAAQQCVGDAKRSRPWPRHDTAAATAAAPRQAPQCGRVRVGRPAPPSRGADVNMPTSSQPRRQRRSQTPPCSGVRRQIRGRAASAETRSRQICGSCRRRRVCRQARCRGFGRQGAQCSRNCAAGCQVCGCYSTAGQGTCCKHGSGHSKLQCSHCRSSSAAELDFRRQGHCQRRCICGCSGNATELQAPQCGSRQQPRRRQRSRRCGGGP